MIGDAFGTIWRAVVYIWPYIDWLAYILLFLFTLKFLEQAWLFLRQDYYKRATEKTLYEIKIPREITRGPKAMEQFFSGLHAFYNAPGSLGEKYYDGETTRDFSFELLGTNGNIHMFMRVPKLYADAIKALLYAQYNDLEIVEMEHDYLDMLPRSYDELSKIGYEIWGMEAGLENKDYFPIKTYAEFEEKSSDERVVDPIAFFMEVVKNMPSDETIMLQFILKPTDDKWQIRGEEYLRQLHEARRVIEDGGFRGRYVQETVQDKEKAKQIQSKIEKDGFRTLIRYIHIAPKKTFNPFFGYRNFFAFFNQLAGDNNRFVKNVRNWTKRDWYNWPFVFPNLRLKGLRRAAYRDYLMRYFPEATWLGKLWRSETWTRGFSHKTPILNTEELATMFHPPTEVVITTGLMERVESKRIAPPSSLPS